MYVYVYVSCTRVGVISTWIIKPHHLESEDWLLIFRHLLTCMYVCMRKYTLTVGGATCMYEL